MLLHDQNEAITSQCHVLWINTQLCKALESHYLIEYHHIIFFNVPLNQEQALIIIRKSHVMPSLVR